MKIREFHKNQEQNAIDERVNGILKDEFYLDQTSANVAQAKRAAKNAINLYNEIRLHLSLNFKTPNRVYKLSAYIQLEPVAVFRSEIFKEKIY